MNAPKRDVAVVRLGGSHAFSPLLRPWLAAIEAAAGNVVLVPGGGPFADAVRDAQRAMGFGELAAHRMALLAMTQYGVALASLCRALVVTESMAGLDAALAERRIPVWSPWPMVRDAPDVAASWDVTSDSLALWLAHAIGAPRVLLVKHVQIHAGTTASGLVAQGVVDAGFPGFLAAYAGGVWLAGPDDRPKVLEPARLPGWRLPRKTGS